MISDGIAEQTGQPTSSTRSACRSGGAAVEPLSHAATDIAVALVLETVLDCRLQTQNWFDDGICQFAQDLPVPRTLVEAEHVGHLPEDAQQPDGEWSWIGWSVVNGMRSASVTRCARPLTMSSS